MKKLFILIALLFYCSIILLFASPIQAQEDQYDIYLPAIMKEYKSPLEKYQKALQECDETGTTSLECWIGGPDQVAKEPDKAATGVMPAITNSLTTMIIGPLATPSAQTYRPAGAIGGITNLIAVMYANPPASSVEYFADLGRNLGILAKPAYAQGVGFEGLRPILPLWKAFRNVAYLFFTIIFVVIGFAIMFRVKLDPQTVIGIQNAIPRIVVALILVTFSYAIAGLLIDLIYIFISLGVLIVWPIIQDIDKQAEHIAFEQQKYMGLGFMEGVGLIIGGGTKAVWHIVGELLEAGPGGIIGLIADILTAVLAGIGGILATLIIAVVALWVIFKLFLSLIKCYISIILSIIFAPLQIMLGVLPGSQMGFGSWLRNLLANIMVFPAVAIFMLLGWILASFYSRSGPAWTPPVISVGGDALIAIIALGMLLMVHKIPDMVKEAFQLKPFPYGAAIGEAIGPVTGAIAYPYRVVRAGVEKEAGERFAKQAWPMITGGVKRLFGGP